MSGAVPATRAHTALAGVRIGYGVLLLLVPTAALPAVPGDRVGAVVARSLGARHLGQGIGTALAQRWITPRRNALIDGVHAISMVGWAALDRRRRRQALASAVIAGLWVVAEAGTAYRRRLDG
jgi:hypothetical protein